ncbi:MAG: hypothetical protein PUB42_05405 [Firmicutes bacterium]|nr:hypothetical protein [Bacillota bacterium]
MYCPIEDHETCECRSNRCCRAYNRAIALLLGIFLFAIGLIVGTVAAHILWQLLAILITAAIILLIIIVVVCIIRVCCRDDNS